jgi:hypothetical protein
MNRSLSGLKPLYFVYWPRMVNVQEADNHGGSAFFLIGVLCFGEIFDVLFEGLIVGVDVLHVLSVLLSFLL